MSQDSNQQHEPTEQPSSTSDKPKIVFAPGCFDNFEGTQEELQELIAEIHRQIESGDIFKNSRPISDEEMEEIMERKNEPRQ